MLTGSRMEFGQKIGRPITITTRRTGGLIGSVGSTALIGGRDTLLVRSRRRMVLHGRRLGALTGRLGSIRARGIVRAGLFAGGIPLRSRLFSVT
ncbi:hypothetical protein GCM10011588_30960 [Nocardia jinanensis]|uniref:Uncharacterized protein n=1 Tax=Nocardia jinanensis TaxID=382504 RepID=A0A917VU30_9NOCA|nr:hypothetical protein GCM10011588_30960 [Nocardia jinanensis]